MALSKAVAQGWVKRKAADLNPQGTHRDVFQKSASPSDQKREKSKSVKHHQNTKTKTRNTLLGAEYLSPKKVNLLNCIRFI